jgi:hypothetical protein
MEKLSWMVTAVCTVEDKGREELLKEKWGKYCLKPSLSGQSISNIKLMMCVVCAQNHFMNLDILLT